MHIGKECDVCPGMKVHGQKAQHVSEAFYLGDIVRNDGKNFTNI